MDVPCLLCLPLLLAVHEHSPQKVSPVSLKRLGREQWWCCSGPGLVKASLCHADHVPKVLGCC